MVPAAAHLKTALSAAHTICPHLLSTPMGLPLPAAGLSAFWDVSNLAPLILPDMLRAGMGSVGGGNGSAAGVTDKVSVDLLTGAFAVSIPSP